MPSNILVGREQEWSVLSSALQRVIAGRAEVVFLRGTLGVGKTELLKAFCAKISNQYQNELYISETRCLPITADGSAYQPFVDFMLEQNYPRKRTKFSRVANFISELGPEWIQLIPVFGSLISASAKTTQWFIRESHQPDSVAQARVQTQFLDFVRKLNQQYKAVVFAIDDIQWLDRESGELWLQMAEQLKHLPILLLATVRDDILSDGSDQSSAVFQHILNIIVEDRLVEGRPVHELVVSEFSAVEVRSYVQLRLHANDVQDAFVHWLVRHTGGNPLLLSHITSALLEAGHVSIVGGRLKCALDIEAELTVGPFRGADISQGLPPVLKQLVEHRIRQLSTRQTRVLMYGSVQGEEFLSSILGETINIPELELIRDLQEVSHYQDLIKIRQSQYSSLAETYCFSHRVVWQAAYSQLTTRERALLHRAVATSYEENFTETPIWTTEHLLLMAEHWNIAGDTIRSARYLLNASQRSLVAGLYSQATRFRQQALESLANIQVNSPEAKNVKLEILLQNSVRLVQDGQIQLNDLESMQQLAKELNLDEKLANVYMLRYWFFNLNGDALAALSAADEALAVYCELGCNLGRSESLAAICKMKARLGDLSAVVPIYQDALAAYEQAMATGEEDLDKWVFFYLHRSYGLALSDLGNLELGIHHLSLALDMARQRNNWFQQLDILGHLAEQYLLLGQYRLAEEAATAGLSLGHGHNFVKWQRIECQTQLGSVALATGNYESALNCFQELYDEVVNDPNVGWWHVVPIYSQLAWTLLFALGHAGLEQAARLSQSLIDVAGNKSLVHGIIQGFSNLALIAMLQGNTEQASELANRAVIMLAEHRNLVAVAEEEIYYVGGRVFAALYPSKSEECFLKSDHERDRKAALLNADEWRTSYLRSVEDNRKAIDALTAGAKPHRKD